MNSDKHRKRGLLSAALLAIQLAILSQSSVSFSQSPCIYFNVEWPDSLCLYWKARSYDQVDQIKARDTMKRYCEEHPFATKQPGEVLPALGWVGSFTADIAFRYPGGWSNIPWIEYFNWLIDRQPANPEARYQQAIFSNLASAASEIDWNLECDLLYTMIHLFGSDPAVDTNSIWRQIYSIRGRQIRGEIDTTPLTIIKLPLKKLSLTATVAQNAPEQLEIRLAPNPAVSEAALKFRLENHQTIVVTLNDVLGKQCAEVFQGPLEQGEHSFHLELSHLNNGIYYIRIITEHSIQTKKLLVNRSTIK